MINLTLLFVGGAVTCCAGTAWVLRGQRQPNAARQASRPATRAVILTEASGLAGAVTASRAIDTAAPVVAPSRNGHAAPTPAAAATAAEPSRVPTRSGKWDPFGLMRKRLEHPDLPAPAAPSVDDTDVADAAPVVPELHTNDVALPPVDAVPLGGSQGFDDDPATVAAIVATAASFVTQPTARDTSELWPADEPVTDVAPNDAATTNDSAEGGTPAEGVAPEETLAVETVTDEERDLSSFLFAGLDIDESTPATMVPGEWTVDFYGAPMDVEERRLAIDERIRGLAISANEAIRIYRSDPEIRDAMWASAMAADDVVRRAIVAMALLDSDPVRVTDAIDVAILANDMDLLEHARRGPYADYITMRESTLGIDG